MRGRERVRFRDVELDDEELGLSFSWLFRYVRIPQKLA